VWLVLVGSLSKKKVQMLVISGSYQNYPDEAVSIQLTDGGKGGECVGGGVESVDV
jgi:hypothetical protein